MARVVFAAVIACLLLGCARERAAPALSRPVATSLLGRALHAEAMTPERRAKLEAQLGEARAALAAEPGDEGRIIWYGRRLAYLGRYEEAIAAFTHGIELHPESYRLLRHRGHRYVTLRRLDEALADLTRAAELMRGRPDAIEPDGMPNERNLPRSTDHSNVWYHLGLVRYLRGEYGEAERAFAQREGLAAYNDDMLVSTTHWRCLALRRMGRDEEAAAVLGPIRAEMDVIENQGYHRLCLLYKGLLSPGDVLPASGERIADAATAYGVAAWLGLEGRAEESRGLLERIANETSWAAFGHVAAEADLARAGPGVAR